MMAADRDKIIAIVDAVVAEERKERMRETDGLFRRIMEQGEAHDRLAAQVRTLEKKVLDLDGIGIGTFAARLAKLGKTIVALQARMADLGVESEDATSGYLAGLQKALKIMEGREG